MELFIIFGGAYALYTVGMAIATELDYRAVNKKIPGHDSYSDLRGVFDDLYERLNKIEEDIAINGSLPDRDRSELSEPD